MRFFSGSGWGDFFPRNSRCSYILRSQHFPLSRLLSDFGAFASLSAATIPRTATKRCCKSWKIVKIKAFSAHHYMSGHKKQGAAGSALFWNSAKSSSPFLKDIGSAQSWLSQKSGVNIRLSILVGLSKLVMEHLLHVFTYEGKTAEVPINRIAFYLQANAA